MLRKGHGGLYKAPTKEERRKRVAKRIKRDQIKFIDLRFERWQVVGLRKARRQGGMRRWQGGRNGGDAETSTFVSLDIDRQN